MLEYINNKVGLQGENCPFEFTDNLYFNQYWNGEASLSFTDCLIVKKQILQSKLFVEINFFLIIIHIFVNFKVFIFTS